MAAPNHAIGGNHGHHAAEKGTGNNFAPPPESLARNGELKPSNEGAPE
jgi:hypothetical protein